MTLIILHCFYHDNEIRGYAQSRPQGLIKKGQGFSFISTLWRLLRKTYFHSTKKGLSLVDSWSHGALTKFK